MEIGLRGQGATEYLVLLAVVLIIALVSIALLGFFPGLATDARITQSDSYWKGSARPFAVLDHSVTAGGVATLVVSNVDASGTMTMNNITLSNGSFTTATTFAPGETRTISITGVPSGTAGTVYDLPINISYRSQSGVTERQFGAKNIVGKYS